MNYICFSCRICRKLPIFTAPRSVRDSLFVRFSVLSLLYSAVILKRKTMTFQQIEALRDFRQKVWLLYEFLTVDLTEQQSLFAQYVQAYKLTHDSMHMLYVLKQRTHSNIVYTPPQTQYTIARSWHYQQHGWHLNNSDIKNHIYIPPYLYERCIFQCALCVLSIPHSQRCVYFAAFERPLVEVHCILI